jgi:anhydro-N-acetylmuramic acid kinase
MTVAGIMSGTSADGIDVAIVRIQSTPTGTKLKFLAHLGTPFTPSLRKSILAAMNATSISTAELARLNWRLGIAYANAVKKTLEKHPHKISLIGCHGQTLYHQAKPANYLGKKFACTWQLGEPAILASELNTPVVSNFRPADMLAGGQGAPLVPFLDFTLFAHPTRARVLQNIGGIANLTAIPPDASADQLIAFDTGPGNMLIDALAELLFNQPFDSQGRIAASGRILTPVHTSLLRNPFFVTPPPRTAGREQFGREYAQKFLNLCRKHSSRNEDALATATALTADSITHAYKTFVQKKFKSAEVDYIVSGGGARNQTLMAMLATRLCPLGCELSTSESHGIPAEAKEAAAFALLAWQTWHHLPGNIPAATGASKPVLLGQVTYV